MIGFGIGPAATAVRGLVAMKSPGELGARGWWEFWDTATLFQDSAATTPVTASGDPVGYAGDKSGQGLHLTQATASARPLWSTARSAGAVVGDGVSKILWRTVASGYSATGFTLSVAIDTGNGAAGASLALASAATPYKEAYVGTTTGSNGYRGVDNGTGSYNTEVILRTPLQANSLKCMSMTSDGYFANKLLINDEALISQTNTYTGYKFDTTSNLALLALKRPSETFYSGQSIIGAAMFPTALAEADLRRLHAYWQYKGGFVAA